MLRLWPWACCSAVAVPALQPHLFPLASGPSCTSCSPGCPAPQALTQGCWGSWVSPPGHLPLIQLLPLFCALMFSFNSVLCLSETLLRQEEYGRDSDFGWACRRGCGGGPSVSRKGSREPPDCAVLHGRAEGLWKGRWLHGRSGPRARPTGALLRPAWLLLCVPGSGPTWDTLWH